RAATRVARRLLDRAVANLDSILTHHSAGAGHPNLSSDQTDVLAPLLFRHDWMILCHADHGLDPAAAGRVYSALTNARARREPLDTAALLASGLRPADDPGPNGSDSVAEFHQTRLDRADQPGFREVQNILQQHFPDVDLARSGMLIDGWTYAALRSKLRQMEEMEHANEPGVRRHQHDPPGTARPGTPGPPSGPPFSPARRQALAAQGSRMRLALETAYDRLFQQRFREFHRAAEPFELARQLSAVILPGVTLEDLVLPPP
ncbi:MAG: hypothetical protein ACKO3N_10150, partial [Verrucomicrobiota bacterium]